jgi:NADH-quinone oxidoreductase subunit L
MVALTFHGEARTSTARDPHGVRWNVKGPLAVLGVLAATVGLVNMVPVKLLTGAEIDFLHQWLDGFEPTSAHHYATLLEEQAGYGSAYAGLGESGLALVGAAVSLGLALTGAALAWRLYAVSEPVEHTRRLGGVRNLLYDNYYQDEYQVFIARRVVLPVARIADTFDQGVIDGAVNGTSSVSLFSGRRVRRVQTGVVTNYALLLTLGFLVLVVAMAITGGWF